MVARIIFPFRGSELGGSHIATFTLASALQRQGVECVIVCPDQTLIMSEARRLGFRVASSGEAPTGANNLATDYAWTGRRRRVLEAIAADCARTVVHCNDVNTLRSWGLAARLAGLKAVYHHHALNRMWWPPHLVSLLYANAVVCVSDSTLEAMRTWRSDATKELNPFRLDARHDRSAARAALLDENHWPSDARIVGWIGNFWERKRPLFFLETALELSRRDPRYRFVLFGRDGDHTVDSLKRRAEHLGIANLTALPGFRQPLEANLASMDLLLAPAQREPFGRALVEAIVLGTPIVATRGAGHTEILGAWGGGQLGNPQDSPAQTAGLCERVLDEADRFALSLERREAIAAQLAPEAHAERVMEIYHRIGLSGIRTRAAASLKAPAVRN